MLVLLFSNDQYELNKLYPTTTHFRLFSFHITLCYSYIEVGLRSSLLPIEVKFITLM